MRQLGADSEHMAGWGAPVSGRGPGAPKGWGGAKGYQIRLRLPRPG